MWERKGIERVLQEAIEAALDVNAHLIAERPTRRPDRIDDAKVLAAVATMLDLYPRYIGAVEDELTRLGL